MRILRFDSQRSTRVLDSSAGSATDTYLYTLFGVELLSGIGTVNPFRFGGQVGYFRDYADADVYEKQFLPRFACWGKLSTINGKWNSQDRIGLRAGDTNFTRFVGNNPVVRVDPSGLITYVPYDEVDRWHVGKCIGGGGNNCCGSADGYWHFRFNTADGNPPSSGIVIQYNVVTRQSTPCGQLKKSPVVSYSFYEVFLIGGGLGYANNVGDHSSPAEDPLKTSCGYWTVSKQAKWIKAYDTLFDDLKKWGFREKDACRDYSSSTQLCTSHPTGGFDFNKLPSDDTGSLNGFGVWSCCGDPAKFFSYTSYSVNGKGAKPCSTCDGKQGTVPTPPGRFIF